MRNLPWKKSQHIGWFRKKRSELQVRTALRIFSFALRYFAHNRTMMFYISMPNSIVITLFVFILSKKYKSMSKYAISEVHPKSWHLNPSRWLQGQSFSWQAIFTHFSEGGNSLFRDVGIASKWLSGCGIGQKNAGKKNGQPSGNGEFQIWKRDFALKNISGSGISITTSKILNHFPSIEWVENYSG